MFVCSFSFVGCSAQNKNDLTGDKKYVYYFKETGSGAKSVRLGEICFNWIRTRYEQAQTLVWKFGRDDGGHFRKDP